MERKIKSFTFIVTILFLFACCKKDKPIDPPSIPNNTVTDIDGNVYHTVVIGTQTWMVENLKVERYRNGDTIPNIIVDSLWNRPTIGAYRDYNDDTNNGITYGHLYNWYAVADSRNIAPVGWHVPSKTEWTTLVDYLGGSNIAGGKMKEIGTSHWASPNAGATNLSGFNGLPGGGLSLGFSGIGEITNWWTSTDWSSTGAYYWGVYYNIPGSSWSSWVKFWGCSVRCVKD